MVKKRFEEIVKKSNVKVKPLKKSLFSFLIFKLKSFFSHFKNFKLKKTKADKLEVISNVADKKIKEKEFKEKKDVEKKISSLKNKKLKEYRKKKKDIKKRYAKKELEVNLKRAGLDFSVEEVSSFILKTTFFLVFSFLIFLYAKILSLGYIKFSYLLLMTFFSLTLGFLLVYGLLWLAFHQFLDLKIYSRRKQVEEVLADFLLLTSSNVRAGMTIDKALWYAVRPRFGVLAKEIEVVAKKTLSGEDLEKALKEFSDSYDSPLLKRSISLLVEGLNAGGEIGHLLNNIALNIQETNLLRQEMAANVTTYALFINFATLFAAPFLFSLAGEILKVVTKLGNAIDIDPNEISNAGGGFTFSFSGTTLTYNDFFLFAIIVLTLTTIMSNVIVSTIKKGDAKEAIMTLPINIGISLGLFILGSKLIGGFLGGLI